MEKSITKQIIDGLKERPAYLLIFGLALIFTSGSFGTGIYGAFNNITLVVILSSIFFFLSLISAIVVIVIVEKNQSRIAIKSPIAQTESEEINEFLQAIFDNIKIGLAKENFFLNKRILDIITKWRSDSSNWKEGKFISKKEEYNNVLLNAYRNAKTNVFSTSTEKYDTNWTKNIGDYIVKAHNDSNAEVLRIFIFSKREEISKNNIRKMQHQHDSNKIQVKVFIDSETPFNFPPEITQDFTIIDGGLMIGITQSFESDDLSAVWYCENEDRINVFKNIQSELKINSLNFKEINDWWKKKQTR